MNSQSERMIFMNNEKIIQIAGTSDELYGLTESGGLVCFDRSIGKFVLKTSGEVMDEDRVNVLKRPVAPIPSAPEGRYRVPNEPVAIDPVKGKTMIDYIMVGAGLAALGFLLWFFCR